jgi:hypothetical protein
MKLSTIFKSSLKIVTVFIPQGALAKVAAGIAIWAVESLVKNSKTTVDDEALKVVKKIVKKTKKK